MTIVPFPRFTPDQSQFSPTSSENIINCKPVKDGWGPLASLVGIAEALPEELRGSCAVQSDAGTWEVYAGGIQNLYKLNSTAYTWDVVSRLADDYLLPDGEFWEFIRFGDWLVATAIGSDFPQFVLLSSGGNFADLTNANFEARLGWVAGDFLVFADIDGNHRKVKWCGINDIFFWTKAQRGSDEQVLADGGRIQRGINQATNALIIQENTIRQMVFDPASGLVFRFTVLDPTRGAYAGRSVVNIGPGDFIYLAKDGWYRGLEAQPIGAERIDVWFFKKANANKVPFISGVADPYNKIVWFRFETNTNTNVLLGYHWQLNEWFYSTSGAVELLSAATAGYTLDDLDQFGNLDALQYSFDSRFWKGGIPGFAGFTSDREFGFFSGPNLEAIIETEDKQLNYPRRAITDMISVLADTDNAQVAIAAKETQAGTLTFGSYRSKEAGHPWIASQVSGRYHRFRVKIPAGDIWTVASGLDPQFTDGGMW